MKILTIVSSYRKKGNTARMAGLIEAHLQTIAAQHNIPLEVEWLYLGHMNLQYCRGCRVCFDQGEEKCPLKDDLLGIKAEMKAADAVILASPVYVEDVNGIMKNWIDRLAFICHRPEFAGKYAYLLTTSGVGSTRHALRTLNTALRTWGFYIIGQTGFKTGAYMPRDEMERRFRHRAQKIAGQIFQAICCRQSTQPSFLSLMTFKIQQRYYQLDPQNSIDYEYWQDNGWTDPRREFYIAHKSNRVTVTFARLVGMLLARFVI